VDLTRTKEDFLIEDLGLMEMFKNSYTSSELVLHSSFGNTIK